MNKREGAFSLKTCSRVISIGVVFFLSLTGIGCSTSRVFQEPVESQRHGFLDGLHTRSSPSRESQTVSRTSVSAIPKHLPRELPRELSRNQKGNVAKEVSPDQGSGFKWPLKEAVVTSSFGKRARDFHEGIDLRAKSGTPVHAALGGTVIYATQGIKGYGRLVVIRHHGKVSSIYAHNSRILVKRGQRVRQGQLIALSGATGRVSGPHVHFEIRNGFSAVDPIGYLPPVAQVRATRIAGGGTAHRKNRTG